MFGLKNKSWFIAFIMMEKQVLFPDTASTSQTSFIRSQSTWMCETMLERSESNWSSLPAADLLHGRADVVHSGSQFVLDCSHYGERHPLSVPVITFIYRPPDHTHFIFTLVWMKPVAGGYTAPGTTSTSTSSCPSSCEPWPCWPKMTSSSIERRSALTSHHWWAHHRGMMPSHFPAN